MPENNKHKEAYCLMLYRCDDQNCQHAEVIWNSRDGVTPFSTRCPLCGNFMHHIDWDRDTYNPHYVPLSGQGVWVDMPEELKVVVARKRVMESVGTKTYQATTESEELVKRVAESMREGEPWLIRWP